MRHLFFIATLLAFVVVVLGAYTRLTDSGLGCPDWPGCYGEITPPKDDPIRGVQPRSGPSRGLYAPTNQQFDSKKAWTEMIHRYFAGTLGLLILIIAIFATIRRFKRSNQKSPFLLPMLLLITVIFQALLGMWTVTLLLHPMVVMGHLMGGMTTLGLCWWLTLNSSPSKSPPLRIRGGWGELRRWPLLALLVLILQIALGGWVSANYAALACPDFPTCMGKWIPPMDFGNAFTVWKQWGQNFEGGILTQEGRVAIQILHRIGALVTFLILGFLAVKGLTGTLPSHQKFWCGGKGIKVTSIIMILLLLTQITLGISTVLFTRPLEIATAHNAVAALLLLSTITLNDLTGRPKI